jgi:hypothetical protein
VVNKKMSRPLRPKRLLRLKRLRLKHPLLKKRPPPPKPPLLKRLLLKGLRPPLPAMRFPPRLTQRRLLLLMRLLPRPRLLPSNFQRSHTKRAGFLSLLFLCRFFAFFLFFPDWREDYGAGLLCVR